MEDQLISSMHEDFHMDKRSKNQSSRSPSHEKKKNKIEDDDGYYANTTDLPSKKK